MAAASFERRSAVVGLDAGAAVHVVAVKLHACLLEASGGAQTGPGRGARLKGDAPVLPTSADGLQVILSSY